ncbi:MAG: biopolymer transporter ExbD [Candidatus Eisenbacteria bacterium]|nr:biopolymer transporter ExbD [Candidatus Eisenbacteria bacterium]
MARLVSRRHRARAGLKASSSVNLISMMDILTVLLLFLLKSYSAGGEVMVPQPGVRLPESTAEKAPDASLVVAIDGDAIKLGSEKVASVAEVAASRDAGIPALAARLPVAAANPAAGAAQATTVTIQGDRAIEYSLLRKVMFTLSQSGYDNVSLAVLRKA